MSDAPTFALYTIYGPGLGSRTLLSPGRYVIGRDPRCDLVVDDDSVSRQHAVVTCREDGSITVADLHSTCGIYVNDNAISTRTVVLGEGDVIKIARVLLRLVEWTDEYRSMHEQIERVLRARDSRTGLLSRYGLRQVFEEEYAGQATVTLVGIDVVGLQRFNDQYGSSLGDRLLRELALRCQAWAKREEVEHLARLGGDSLVLLVREDRASATAMVQRLCDEVAEEPLRVLSEEVAIELHPVVVTREDVDAGAGAEALLQAVEVALHLEPDSD